VSKSQFWDAFIDISIAISFFLALFGTLVVIAYLAKRGGTLAHSIGLTGLVSLTGGMLVGLIMHIAECRVRRGEGE